MNPAIAPAARALGLDVVSCHERGRRGLDDDEQLRYAAAEGRCSITTDVIDFQIATARAREHGEPHAGVLKVVWQVRKGDVRAFAAALARFDAAHPDGLASYEEVWFTQKNMAG